MSDADAPQVGFDLVPENFSALQSLVFSMAYEFSKTKGVGRGRGHIMAEDYIAENLLNPKPDGTKISGTELSAFLAFQRNGFRSKGKAVAPVAELTQTVLKAHQEHEVHASPDVDTFNQRVTGKTHSMDPLLAAMLEACTPIKRGEVWSIPAVSEDKARELAGYMPRVAKLLGWRVGNRVKSYQFQIFPDRLKIKRN